jgi:hypothetical protein
MAFKNMNDVHRRRALTPFLEAAEHLEGHVVVVAVTKKLCHMSAGPTSMEVWQGLHGLQAKWDLRAFERMTRVAHFFSMFLGEWSSPGMDVTWIGNACPSATRRKCVDCFLRGVGSESFLGSGRQGRSMS